MKLFWSLILIIFSFEITAQYRMNVELNAGMGYNGELFLNGEYLESKSSFNLSILLNQEFYTLDKVFANFGLGGIIYRSNGKHRISEYSAKVTRFLIDGSLGYDIANPWSIVSGINLSTSRDTKDLDIHRHDNLRWDWYAKLRYLKSQRTTLILLYRYSINDIGDSYYLGAPKHNFALGVQYYLIGSNNNTLI